MQTRKIDRETLAILERCGVDPASLPQPKKKKKNLAGELQKKALAELERLGCMATRTNAGLFRALYHNGKVHGCIEGWPDITGCSDTGRFVGCEVKAGRDVLSDMQRYRLNWMRDRGALVGVVRELKDVSEILAGRGIIA